MLVSYKLSFSLLTRIFIISAIGLIFGACIAAASGSSSYQDGNDDRLSNEPSPSEQQLEPTHSVTLLHELQTALRKVVAEILPVVVKIDTTVDGANRRSSNLSPLPFRPREFEQPGGTGSGIIVRRENNRYYVLTNNHVIADTSSILLTLDDGREFQADLVGRDPRQDISLISFEESGELPIARLGDSSTLMVGDLVLAVGSPFGFQSTVTSGIISALGRETSGRMGINIAEYIQTDAAINPGNSGGALVTLSGEVIGINTWIASRDGGNVGVGFALPINAAQRAINDFIESGSVRYGYLGIFVSSASDSMREALGVVDLGGALAWSLVLESPAAVANFQPGDWITHINGLEVLNSSELVRAVGALIPEQESRFTVYRDGKTLELRVTIGLRDESAEIKIRDWPGIFPIHLDDKLRATLDIGGNQSGVMVGQINESSAASTAGIRHGDVIIRIDNKVVRDAGDFYDALNSAKRTEHRFELLRQGNQVTIIFNP